MHMTSTIPAIATPIRLITIPVSHYCEKARWALMRLQIPFVEERHMPPFHRFATRRVPDRSTNSTVIRTESNLSPLNRFVSRVVGGQAVPVLFTGTAILKDSAEILRWVDEMAPEKSKLYPIDPQQRQQVDELIRMFDAELAPAVRLWLYFYIFDRSELIKPLWCQGVPWFERLLFPVVFHWMRSNVFQMYAIDEESQAKAHACICRIFEQVDHLLADGRAYLVGDQFSAADLTFATLAAAVVLTKGYGVTMPDLDSLPAPMVANIQAFRETHAGKFVLRLYEEHGSSVS
jgi:glutathione S-transferase